MSMESDRNAAAQSDYHLVRISERRFGVAKILSHSNSTDPDRPAHFRMALVAGLERVNYAAAVDAVDALNSRRKNESYYEKE